MTLHEAIELAINIEGKPASTTNIADAINSLSIYQREDGKPVEANQIAARVKNHPFLFGVTKQGLIFNKKETQVLYQRLVYHLKDLLRNIESRNVDVIIATYIFLERVRNIYPEYLDRFRESSFSFHLKADNKTLIGKYNTGFEMTTQDEELITGLFQSLSPTLELRVHDLLKQYDFSKQASSEIEFGIFYNELLNSSSLTKGALGDFATPASISKIIADMADVKMDEVVFDPFGGNAGLFCDIRRVQGYNFKLRINDIDKYCVLLGKMNLVLSNLSNFEYTCQNSVEEYIAKGANLKKYDWIITHPPFGGRLPDEIVNAFNDTLFGHSSKSELIFIELILNQLNDKGKAIIIVPESFLFVEDKVNVRARKFLVNNGWLHSVISLPAGAFLPYTSAKASILLIHKGSLKYNDDHIHFVELSEEDLKDISSGYPFSIRDIIKHRSSQSVPVNRKEVEKEKYSLVVNRFLKRNTTSFDNEHVQLKELIVDKFSGFTHSQKHLNRNDGIPYINIKDLSDEKKHFKLNSEKVSTFLDATVFQGSSRKRDIPQGSILLAKIGNKLKPTLNASNAKIAASANILVIIPDSKKISATYLISQLHEDYVLQQVDRIRGGAAQPFVRIDDLLNVFIKVPSLEAQNEVVQNFALGQMDNLALRDMQELTTRKEEIDLPSAIKHEYKNLKNPLSSNISNIRDFLEQKIAKGELINWDDKIAANTNARSIQTVFSDIDEIMGEMSSLIDDIVVVVNLDKEGNVLSAKNVSGLLYFESLAKRIQKEKPEVQLVVKYTDRIDFNGVVIEIDDNLFSKVIRNFVSNSIEHGYLQSAEKPVYVILSISDDKLMLQIDLINDGKPFEDGFTFSDFISFGRKAGANKGSGIGGFIMNRIVLHHKGELEMITVEKEDSLGSRLTGLMKTGVHFRIKLPIIK